MNKKGEGNSLGLVIGLVFGIAALVIGVIIAFVIVGTISGAKIIPQGTYAVTNESDLTGADVYANTSGYNVAGVTAKRNPGSFTLTKCWAEYYLSNGTATASATLGGYNISLTSTNCSISSDGNLSGQGATYNFPNVSVSYSYVGDSPEILTVDNMTSNFSSGTQNISSKIPTVLLIAAIILILAILAVLVALWQRMRLGGGGNL